MSEIVPIDEYCQRNQEILMALASAAGAVAISRLSRSVECNMVTSKTVYHDQFAEPALQWLDYQFSELGGAEPTEAGFAAYVERRKYDAVGKSGNAVLRTRETLRQYFMHSMPGLPASAINLSTEPKLSSWSDISVEDSDGTYIVARTSLHIPSNHTTRLYTSAERHSVTYNSGTNLDEVNLLSVNGRVVGALHYSEADSGKPNTSGTLSSTPDTSLLDLLADRLSKLDV